MILWRFAGEIMRDENAWLTGTGIGSRQEILNSYYIKYGVYTGNPDLGDKGYLGYNFHNQYLEVMVGTGIPGLILLLSNYFIYFYCRKTQANISVDGIFNYNGVFYDRIDAGKTGRHCIFLLDMDLAAK